MTVNVKMNDGACVTISYSENPEANVSQVLKNMLDLGFIKAYSILS